MTTITRAAALGLGMLLLPALTGWSGGRQEESLPVELDVEIQSRVEEWLENQDRFHDSEIFVSVTDGEVTLKGKVPSYALKQRAGLEVRGVVNVVNKIVVVPTEKILDQAIAEDIVARIDVDPNVRVEDVHVIVEQGRVTLSGIVLSPAARNAAEQAAVRTHGVTEVDNRIVVGG